ncbi:DUF3558 domain-containing protein [Pseudonocardia humida]|uniref:DUF3558 domain-containing protein n=1 Tax=Pseudonocardia humida TaxID=2800819 RepID=A0ABT1ACP1_9PSEU|nr:DUF3558 domain-containing protein [Pseudonocardia humida]MCO1660731.1 DUF3558 domain-containing protein [Pseudonocardia humida]
MRRLLMLLTIAIAVVSCSAPVAGEASPARQGAEGTGDAGLPTRPRELPLDDVDPCALLTPTQRTDLGITSEPLPDTTDAPLFAGRTCSMTGFEPRDIGVSFALATGSGIAELLAPGTLGDEVTPTTIAGFPAVIAKPELPNFCSVDVDVAEGQFLDVQFHDSGSEPPIPPDQLCRDAVRVAEAAMETLQRS